MSNNYGGVKMEKYGEKTDDGGQNRNKKSEIPTESPSVNSNTDRKYRLQPNRQVSTPASTEDADPNPDYQAQNRAAVISVSQIHIPHVLLLPTATRQ